MYDVKKTLHKVVKYSLIVGIPFLATEFPDVFSMTIGAALIGILDFLKHRNK